MMSGRVLGYAGREASAWRGRCIASIVGKEYAWASMYGDMSAGVAGGDALSPVEPSDRLNDGREVMGDVINDSAHEGLMMSDNKRVSYQPA